jgi:hypothetical protein
LGSPGLPGLPGQGPQKLVQLHKQNLSIKISWSNKDRSKNRKARGTHRDRQSLMPPNAFLNIPCILKVGSAKPGDLIKRLTIRITHRHLPACWSLKPEALLQLHAQ